MTLEAVWPMLTGNRALSSVILIIVMIALRQIAKRLIWRNAALSDEVRRAWLARTRNMLVGLAVAGLFFIWLPALHTFALSITAVALALVVATKELLLCISGTVLRAINRPFRIGDWVAIGDYHGEVSDETMFATTLEETAKDSPNCEFTGRTVTVPNSLFLTTAIKNHQFLKRWHFLETVVIMEPDVDMLAALPAIERDVEQLHARNAEAAERFVRQTQTDTRLDMRDITPDVAIKTTDIGNQRIEVTIFCPTNQASGLEREINRLVLGYYWQGRREARTPSRNDPVSG
jgi:small-conductance mechanosensitive channel